MIEVEKFIKPVQSQYLLADIFTWCTFHLNMRRNIVKTVTLDALIPREDFEIISTIGSSGNTRNKLTLSIEDLKYDSFFFSALRKPIFQRETNEWEPQKIISMIESFLHNELVPSIILWRNQGGYIFVIDGAHRLSSLGAWINDDYGDGTISQKFYSNYISTEQKEVADKTRTMLHDRFGSFSEVWDISRNLTPTDNIEKKELAKNLGALALQVQWVDGDASKAEDSFLKINQSATKISDAELELIANRNNAFAIAARAVIRAGKGYQYWSNFSNEYQNKIIEKAKDIHDIMFGKKIFDINDVNSFPLAGPRSSNLTLDVVTQTIKICNGIENSKFYEQGTEEKVMEYLSETLLVLEYINSKKPYSLGIHPFIYFYSDLGKHKIASYYGFLMFIKELISQKKLNDFIENRALFEQVVYQYSFLVQQIVRRYRQSKRAFAPIKEYLGAVLNIISTNKTITLENAILTLKQQNEFKFLQTEIVDNELSAIKGNFSRGKKQQIKLRTYVAALPKCPICQGYMDNNSISVDHIHRKQDGGTNATDNGQVTHMYCNTTYKS